MENRNTEAAFAAAFANNDCAQLIGAVEHWGAQPHRTPENVLEVIPCVQSGMDAFFARKEDECRRAWNATEARAWQEARATFDAGMRAFVKAIAVQPNSEVEAPSRPAIGGGWGKQASEAPRPFRDGWGRPIVPKHDAVPA
jgi:hypothetical protein